MSEFAKLGEPLHASPGSTQPLQCTDPDCLEVTDEVQSVSPDLTDVPL